MSATSTTNSLPELSTSAWIASLVAALLCLALGVYPFVAYRAVARLLPPEGAPMLAIFAQPSVPGVFAAATFIALLLTFSGKQRTGVQRSRLAYVALAIAMLGVALLIVALSAIDVKHPPS